MNIKILFSLLVTAIVALGSCNVDAEYYSQVTPETFFDSPDKVYQRMNRPFTHWAWGMSQYAALSDFIFLEEFTSDELVMPNRQGDWYDDGAYVIPYAHQFKADMPGIYDTWRMFSMGVAQVWSAKEDIETLVDFEALGFDNPQADRDAVLMQLQTLAAFFYWIGLDHFGGVPLYKSNLDDLKGRSTDKETFDYLEGLLLEAIPKLPVKVAGAPETGHINQAAAAVLLARLYFNANVYIGQDMFSQAATICQDIIDGKYGSYELAPSYQDIFGFTNENCKEIIWAVPNENAKRPSDPKYFYAYSFHYNMGEYLDNLEQQAWNGYCLTPSLDIDGKSYLYGSSNPSPKGAFRLGCPYAKLEPTDLRKQNYAYKGSGEYQGMFLAGKMVNPITGKVCAVDGGRDYPKGDTVVYVDQIAELSPTKTYTLGRKEGVMNAEENSGVRIVKWSPVPNSADKALWGNPDIPVFRLTEVYYMLAECKYRAGDPSGAANLFNQVRARYFEGGADTNPVTAANIDKYRILDEWLIEFVGEGRRRTDLVRWDAFITENWFDHVATNKANFNRFPVPEAIITSNPLIEQNPGY